MYDLRNKLLNKSFLQGNKIFISLIFIVSLFRILIGVNIPIWLVIGSYYDDLLLLDYSHLITHFTDWNIISLVKDLSYSIFLSFVRFSGLSYRFWISIMWIIAAVLMSYGIYRFLTKNKKVIFLAFLFILFLPMAFEVNFGLRIYRNAIQAPFTIIFLSTLYIFINYLFYFSNSKTKNVVLWAIILGFIFTFNYYIKEDGILTLPIFLACIFGVLIYLIYTNYLKSFKRSDIRNIIKISIIAILPIIIFAGCTVAYQEANYHYFGVHEINTRTSGEMGDFYSNLLKIDDDNKTTQVWIPASTVEKAYNASPTLQKHPEFIDAWMHTPWADGILINSTIYGDLPTWSLRYALNNSGLFSDEKSVNDMFYSVNKELDQAFENGSLKKSEKIFITSSANGKDIGEISELSPFLVHGLRATLFFEKFKYGAIPDNGPTTVTDPSNNENYESDLNDHLSVQKELDNPSFLEEFAKNFAMADGIVYHLASYVIALLVFVSFIWLFYGGIKERFKNPEYNILLLFSIMAVGTLLVQIFAVSWFCAWLGFFHLRFYLPYSYGTYAVLAVLTIVGAYSLKFEKQKSDL